MRIQIDFHKKIRTQTILALERFLNYNLIETSHGLTFEAIFITLIENPKKTQKFKRKFLYHQYADISIPFNFTDYNQLNLVDFKNAYDTILQNIDVINEIEVKNKDFNISLLKTDLNLLKASLPNTISELKVYIENSGQLDKEIHLKRMNCRTEQRINNKKILVKKIDEFRAYDKKEHKLLRPYLNKITEILENNLKSNPLLSPSYAKIYFSISDTLEDAKTEFPMEEWYEYTYGVLDYDKFEKLDIKNRFVLLSEIFNDALLDICRIDGLDKTTIEILGTNLKKDLNDFLSKSSEEQISSALMPYPRNEKL